MRVIFVRVDRRRYGIGIDRGGRRDIGPDVPVRPGPGPAAVPHDLVHFAVEEQARLRLGIFGQVAAGGSVRFFVPLPADRSAVDSRRTERLYRAGRRDLARSEQLAALVGPGGRWRADADAVTGDPRLTAAIRTRLGELLGTWAEVPDGGRMVVAWPAGLTVRYARVPAA